MVTPASFRAFFPEFANTGTYTDVQINQYIAFALRRLPADSWGDDLDDGVTLFVAHWLTVSARDQAAAAAGSQPGGIEGAIASMSVDKVSVSYDAASVGLENAGFWGLSSYGLRFL